MKIKQRNPKINNVYPEIGSSFGTLAIAHPVMCQHLIGKNIKHYGADHVIWGTDCLWWGSPQWVIDAFKRFQISDELCEKFGYKKLTKEDKAKIFGLNAAKSVRHRRRRKTEDAAQGRAVEAQDGLPRDGRHARKRRLRLGARRYERVAGSFNAAQLLATLVGGLAPRFLLPGRSRLKTQHREWQPRVRFPC